MGFAWNDTVSVGAMINISASSFNSLVDKINAAYSKGAKSNAGISSAQKVTQGEDISASKINKLASALWGLGGTSGS